MKPHLSIVSPVYRAEDCLQELYRRLVAAAEAITPDFELVLVEDGGPDRSWAVIEELAARDVRVKGIKLSRNFGQHYAITAGLDHADGDWVVVMDCDLQDQPEEIGKLYRKAQEGYDIVFARRAERQDSLLKTLPGLLFHAALIWLTGMKSDRTVSNFSVCARRAILAFRSYRERDRAFVPIMHLVGFRRAYVDVHHAARFAGETSYTWGKLIAFATQNIVAASTRPLRMSIRFGLFVSGSSLLFSIYLIVRYFTHRVSVAGWTSLAVLMSFFFGMLFIQLGVMGLYLGKVFETAKGRPLYHVAECLNMREPS